MTTLVGIATHLGEKNIILGADTLVKWTQTDENGYETISKSHDEKIFVDKAREMAVAVCGPLDDLSRALVGSLIDNDLDFRKILEEDTPDFEALRNINEARWGLKTPNKRRTELMIATRYDGEPKLYSCFSLGAIEEEFFCSMGSGEEYIMEYTKKQGAIKQPPRLYLDDGIDFVVGALDMASQNLETEGLNFAVVRPNEIREYGNVIESEMNAAKRKTIGKIKEGLMRDDQPPEQQE